MEEATEVHARASTFNMTPPSPIGPVFRFTDLLLSTDQREHVGALALASLGATTSDEHDSSASSESSQWCSGIEDIRLPQAQPKIGRSAGQKRKFEELNAATPPTLTWPSLAFSSSLNPLEVRLTIGGNKAQSEYQVTVARSVADIPPNEEGWEHELPSHSDKMVNISREEVSDDNLEIQWSTQECTQSSDWQNHGSQASPFFLEELSESQISLPTSW